MSLLDRQDRFLQFLILHLLVAFLVGVNVNDDELLVVDVEDDDDHLIRPEAPK